MVRRDFAKSMSVEFDEEAKFNNIYNKGVSSTPSGLTAWLIKKGYAKNEKGANNIMILVTVICFALAIYFAI